MTGSVAADGQTPITGNFQFAAGSATNPPITFTIDNTSGFYLIGAGNPGITAGGVGVLSITSTGSTITGTLGVSGNFAVNTNKFTVDSSTGNTAIAGTLTVTGACTFTTALNLSTANYANSSVTYAKIQNEANNTFLGNFSGGAAAPSEYSLGNNLAVTSTTLDTKYGPKAWVTFTYSGGIVTIQKSFNVTSVVRNSTGNFTITFTNAMTDAYYVPVGSAYKATNPYVALILPSLPLVGSFVAQFWAFYTDAAQDPAQASIIVFGN